MPNLVQEIPNGGVDIVGDVHGEFDALLALLSRLGYSPKGIHPDERKLIFVGDLTDRGPDSIAVVAKVGELVESGNARCVLGNHDLNLLLDERKFENGWFYGDEFLDKEGNVIPQRLASDVERKTILDFFATLPLALERDDLRIVHACWNDEMIGLARNSTDVIELYREHEARISRIISGSELDETGVRLYHQNLNPVKLTTSGPEEITEQPEFAGGRYRNERRVKWWLDYEGPYCVFGHYGIPLETKDISRAGDHAFCIDYKAGNRWKERKTGMKTGFAHKLGALRYPERQVVFDDPFQL